MTIKKILTALTLLFLITTLFVGAVSAYSISTDNEVVLRGNSFNVTIVGNTGETVNVIYDTSNLHYLSSQTGITELTGGIQIILESSGSKTIQFDTDSTIVNMVYRIKAVFEDSSEKYVRVTVERGDITIISDADSYYIGDEITVSGTNTDSDNVYLYIKGSNKALQEIPTTEGYATTAISPVVVSPDNTWTKSFTIANNFDEGTYSIYAVSDSYAVDNHIVQTLTETQKNYAYATTAFTLKYQFYIREVSSDSVARGDTVKVSGLADFNPDMLLCYIFGTNYYNYKIIVPNDDGTFSVNIDTGSCAIGQYTVFIQHPMYDNLFNVRPGDMPGRYYIENGGVYESFSMSGRPDDIYSFATVKDDGIDKLVYIDHISDIDSGSISTIQSVYDLINNNDYFDDISRGFSFIVELPSITINAIADMKQGATFTVSGTTNVAVGEDVTIDVVSTKFQAEPKASIPASSYISKSTKIVAGSNGVNTYSATFDSGELEVDEYVVVSIIDRTNDEDYRDSTTFDILLGDDNIKIKQGWNFISIPKTLDPSENTASKVFKGIDTDGKSILGYNAQTKTWEALKENTQIKPLTGYWIYSKTDDSIELTYTSDPTTPPAKSVYEGWNAVGLSENEATPAQNALAGTKWVKVRQWNIENKNYDTAITKTSSPDQLIQLKNGYWLYVESDGTLI